MNLMFLTRTSFRWSMPTTRERRYMAAQAIILSVATFELLDTTQRSLLDREIISIYEPFGVYPWWRTRPDASRTLMAAAQAIGMWRLGSPTAALNLTWSEVLHRWHRDNPALLMNDFKRFHADTDRALSYLESKGVRPPESEHYGLRWLEQARRSPASVVPP